MGFFSSRKTDDLEEKLDSDATVVQVIRSRFVSVRLPSDPSRPAAHSPSSAQYGKHKGKGREAASNPEIISLRSSLAPSSDPSRDNHSTYDSGSLRHVERKPPPSPRARPPALTIATDTHRTQTDTITITLAQRLNELAVANSQGLLDDDEYRLLRQSLFERLAGGSAVPSETPLVPVAGPPREFVDGRRSISSAHQHRTSSTYQASTSRPPSVQSKRSFTSSVSGFLKRASSRRQSGNHDSSRSDTASVFSSPKTPDRAAFTPSLSRPSEPSLRTASSHTFSPSDDSRSRSLKHERTPLSRAFRSDSASRSSGRSIRRAPSVPPSSFPGTPLNQELKLAQMSVIDTLADDEELQTSEEIREAIDKIEAEGRRLLDAFNGLELSTLVRQQRRPGHAPLATATLLPSPVDSDPHWKNAFSPPASVRGAKENDAMSTRSGGSARTALSRKRSPSVTSRTRQLGPGGAPVLQPVTLGRKNSISSISSRNRSGTAPSLPVGRLAFGSTSSLNLRGSSNHLPLAPVSEIEPSSQPPPLPRLGEDIGPKSPGGSQYSGSVHPSRSEDDDILALEAEMSDIRRRRAEVTARYEARIEYLRARLKGAELREKLLKR
ncbi:hypothetical protein EIP86_008219 [Pleurotus ostreatoroseus]|nr:hypothetical protein EIP86_008219 [Pleurotus ostreatoroseus]